MSGALKVIGWLTIAAGVLSPTFLMAGDNSGAWVIVTVSGIVSGVFILSFAKIIDILTNIHEAIVAQNIYISTPREEDV